MFGKRLFRRIANCRKHSVRNSKNDSSKRLLDVLISMPKPQTARVAEAQRQRKQISKKAEKYAPSAVYLQVLGSGARGVPNTLYMFTDQKRYLFNCGECTQRLAHEHKVKLSRLNHIFITNKSWKNIGGLPGLSLTLQDVGVPSITLHGPEGLDELYTATKRFVIMKNMEVSMAKCSNTEDFEDGVMSVKYIYLSPYDSVLDIKDIKQCIKKQKLNEEEEYKEFLMDETDYYNNPVTPKKVVSKCSERTDKFKKSKPELLDKVLIDYRKKECTVAYVCTLKKRLGTLNLEKCVAMGVKPGPLLGQLKAGRDVILDDGRLVFSSDVKTPDDPGPLFIVIEVPEISYLKESEFSMYFDDGINPCDNIPTLVVHFTPPEVFNLPKYQHFISQFGSRTQHLVLNTGNSCLGSEAVHRTQHRLHLLDPDIFPLLRDVSIPTMWNAHTANAKVDDADKLKCWEELKNKIAMAQFQSIIEMASNIKEGAPSEIDDGHRPPEPIEARTLTTYHLRPKKTLDRSLEPKLHIQDYIQEAMDADGFANSLEQLRRVAEACKNNVTSSEYPKVVFLGTGSCIPSKTRNTSAIVVQVDERHSLLLDCGEGTFSQLVRFYSQKRIDSFLRTLKAIYISHLHADHHMGLITLLKERRAAFQEAGADASLTPLYLLAPGQIMSWLAVYDQKFERIRNDYTLVPNQSLVDKDALDYPPMMLHDMGLSHVQTCFVAHCPNAFGVAITIGDQKITYSGDTIPCDNLVKLGENSTLLIHEATMEDELVQEARMKMHSTTTQAIEVGNLMNAKYTILTHFSQRYARLPRLNSNILNDNKKVGIAFDNMKVRMGDLDLLPHMYGPLQLMFAEHCVEMEVKAAHRAIAKSREKSLGQPQEKKHGMYRRSPSTQIMSSISRAGREESLSPNRQSRSPSGRRKVAEDVVSNTTTITKPILGQISRLDERSSSPLAYKLPIAAKSVENKTPSLLPSVIDGCGIPIRQRSPSKNVSTRTRDAVSPSKSAENRTMQLYTNVRDSLSTLTESVHSGHTTAFSAKDTLTSHITTPESKQTAHSGMVPNRDLTPAAILKERMTATDIAAPAKHTLNANKDLPDDDNKTFVVRNSRKSFIPKPLTKIPVSLRDSTKFEVIPQTSGPLHSHKAFKPQLENIQSSYILETKNDANSCQLRKIDSNTSRKTITKGIDENSRRALLEEHKRKYRTLHYHRNSKFERIEGLNWISWKN